MQKILPALLGRKNGRGFEWLFSNAIISNYGQLNQAFFAKYKIGHAR